MAGQGRWMGPGCAGMVLTLVVAAGSWAMGQESGSQRRWQPPPPPTSWNAGEHHGYMDGVDAAWIDLAGHLSAKPSRHQNYRHPPATVPVSRQYWYREGYRKGYQVVYRHEQGKHGEAAGGRS